MTRLALIIAAIAALVFAVALSARPAVAGEANPCDTDPTGFACLHDPQQGTDSSEDAGDFPCEGDEVEPGEVLWHFVLNGVSPAFNSPLTINALFDDDGALTDSSAGDIQASGANHHFFVFTSGDDTLLDAWVDLPADTTYNNLVLSHICRGEEGSSQRPSQTPEGSQGGSSSNPSQTPEGSQGGSTSDPSKTPEGSQAGATGTPAASLLNTALGLPTSGMLATIFFGAVLISALGALAYANVVAVRRRR
jgi:hypothetical protein